MLEWFIWGLKAALKHKVLKYKQFILSNACMIAEKIGLLDVYPGKYIFLHMHICNTTAIAMGYDQMT